MIETNKTIDLSIYESLITALTVSDDRLESEREKTINLFKNFMAQTQGMLEQKTNENLALSTSVVQLTTQNRELITTHAAETKALQEKLRVSEEAVQTIRKEMEETARKFQEKSLAGIAERIEAVRVATLAGDARVAAANQGKDLFYNAQLTSLRTELETVRGQKASQLAEVVQKARALESGIDTDLKYGQGDYYPVRDGQRVANACRGQKQLRVLQPNDAYPVNTRTINEVMDKVSTFSGWAGTLR